MDFNVGTFGVCPTIIQDELIMKMSQNNNSVAQARLNFNLLCDFHTLLALSCMLPLLEAMNVLIKFVQGKDVFICNLCSKDQNLSNWPFHMMYSNPVTSYQCEHFQVFCHVVDNNFATITQDWVLTFITIWKLYIFIWLILLSTCV